MAGITSRGRILLIVVIILCETILIVGTTIGFFYTTAFKEEKDRLSEIVRSQARMIESMGQYADGNLSVTEETRVNNILSQVTKAYANFEWIGKTGEFALARLKGNDIEFLYNRQVSDFTRPELIPFGSKFGEPMKRALLGQSGTMVGVDYQGHVVLAAYEPCRVAKLGLVAKIDVSEIRATYFNAGLAVSGLIAIFLALTLFIFFRLTDPIIRTLENSNYDLKREIDEKNKLTTEIADSELRYRRLFETAQDGILLLDAETGQIIDTNPSLVSLLGCSETELVGRKLGELDLCADNSNAKSAFTELLGKRNIRYSNLPLRTKDGRGIIVEFISKSYQVGKRTVIQCNIRDITELMRIDVALRENEKKFSLLADNLREVFWITESKTGKTLYISPAYEKVWGRTCESLYQNPQSYLESVHPDDRAHLSFVPDDLPAGQAFEQEYRIVKPNGDVRWIWSRAYPIADGAGQTVGLAGFSEDITARVEFEKTQNFLSQFNTALSGDDFFKSLAQYLAEILKLDYVRIDTLLDDGLSAQPVVVYNDGIFERDGVYALKDRPCCVVVDKKICCFPSSVRQLFSKDDVLQKTNAESYAGTVLVGSNGKMLGLAACISRKPMENPDHILKLLELVSPRAAGELERRNNESKLRESEEKFLLILNSTAEGIYGIDLNGNSTFCNEAALRLLGYEKRDELDGRNTHALIHHSYPDGSPMPVEECRIFDTFRHGLQAHVDTEVFWRADGSCFPVEYYAYPQYKAGVITGAVVTFTDITERKKNEALILDMNRNLQKQVKNQVDELIRKDQLVQAQSRQAAMGEMIGNIAHQWRQPLNAVGLIIQNMLDSFEYGNLDESAIRRMVDKGMSLIMHMSKTIDDFRNFFKPDKEKTEFSLEESIRKTCELVQSAFMDYGIRVQIDAATDCRVTGYPNEYSQVLLNILNNAKDIFLERQVAEPCIGISVAREGEMGIVLVSDNGGGIPEENIDRVFQPYFTTKALGTGIGLYMSKTIIEKNMDGTLSVKNTGRGAEFRIAVPFSGRKRGAE